GSIGYAVAKPTEDLSEAYARGVNKLAAPKPTTVAKYWIVLWAKEIILSRAFPAQAKRRSAVNCGGAATMPLMVTVNWLIKVTRKPVNRWTASRTSTTFGM